MGIETKVLEVETHDCTIKDTVKRVKAIGRLEKSRMKALNREIIDTMIIGSGKEQRTITMYRNPGNGKHFIEINGKVVHAGDTRAACAERALKAGIYTEREYNRIINKRKGN